MPAILDLNDIVKGKVELQAFQDKLQNFNFAQYEGQEVQIKGCAPTWAHLLVAARLFGKVKKLEFIVDNGKGGIPIEIFKN